MSDIIRRAFRFERRDSEGETPRLVGYAAMFNSRSEDLGGWVEQIAPGAFAESIGQDDIRALWNHDANFVLGRNKAGTLTLAEDERGLAIENEPPDTNWARDLLVTMRRGDVDQMSFAFSVVDRNWEEVDGVYVRTLLKVRLYEVSPVTFPAYNATQVSVRDRESALAELRELTPRTDFEGVHAAYRRYLDLLSF